MPLVLPGDPPDGEARLLLGLQRQNECSHPNVGAWSDGAGGPIPISRSRGAGWAPAGRRRQGGLRGPGSAGTTSLGAKQHPGPLLPPGNGEIILERSCCPQLAFSFFSGNKRIRSLDIRTAVRESPAVNLMCSHRTSSVTNPETTWSLVGPLDLLLSFLLPLY